MTQPLTRTAAAEAVAALGWSYILGSFQTFVAVTSHAQALQVAQIAAGSCGADAEDHLAVDVRRERVQLTLIDLTRMHVTTRDVQLARAITDALRQHAFAPATASGEWGHGVQELEIAIDALDIARIRPFWQAVLGYVREQGPDGPGNAVVDPYRTGPAVWFQQMDQPRPQRNRIHFDITVPHEEADARIAAALEAGGTLVSDAQARSFWVLADAEGNEICVCTWQDRE